MPIAYPKTLFILLCVLLTTSIAVAKEQTVLVTIQKGDGMRVIASKLYEKELINSRSLFVLYALITGRAHLFKPGVYSISPPQSFSKLIKILISGDHQEVAVVIPDGLTIREIDKLLSDKGIINPQALIAFGKQSRQKLEGFLFPDTYRFFIGSSVGDVVKKFSDNFNQKAQPLLSSYGPNFYERLILASLLEKEIPDIEERKIAAGIILKRLVAKWPLQIDAAICYIKAGECHPLTLLDLKIDSPYNTYVYKGLPPTPIANPGLSAIEAALNPKQSSFWFYLSDPKTGKTIFSRTLDEHNQNKARYLRG